MRAFIKETSALVVIPGANCDTDQILPGRFLKSDRALGYGQFLFHDIRRNAAGALDPAFALNRPEAQGATMLLVEDNFGCGSSREGAVYALVDHGIRAIIGPGFGDIFYNNALKNALVPVRLEAALCARLAAHLAEAPEATVTVDLERALITLPGDLGAHPILIDAFARDCILRGLDEIQMTFTHMEAISAFETAHIAASPWLGR